MHALIAALVAVAQPATPPIGDAGNAPAAGSPWQHAQLAPAELRVHDPSTIVREGDSFYFFATGRGIGIYHAAPHDSAPDPATFERIGRVFSRDTLPRWITEVAEDQTGHFWAPDITKAPDGRWRVYYSVSSFGKNTSAIALASSPTLDPSAAEWRDDGIVIRSTEASDFNAIDPAIVETEGPEGTESWMVFGSWWTGIQLVQLDPETGMRLAPDAEPIRLASNQGEPAWNNAIEAADIYERSAEDGRWYYLFVNWGLCCKGAESTYEIRVGRSRHITGPYLDRAGKPLTENGGTPLLASEPPFIGPGHPSVLDTADARLLGLHFYDARHEGRPRYALIPLAFDHEGWPTLHTDN